MNSFDKNIFDKSLYGKSLAVVLGLAVIGLFLSYFYFGSITITDTIGTVISSFIVAFMVQLILLSRRNEID